MKTRDIVATPALMGRLSLDPGRQLVGAQCSGALVLAKLGLLGGMPTGRGEDAFVANAMANVTPYLPAMTTPTSVEATA